MVARLFLLFLGIAIGGGVTYYYQKAELLREQDIWRAEFAEQMKHAEGQALINYQALENLYNEQKAKQLIDDAMIIQYSREIERLSDEVTHLTGELAFYEEMIPAGPDGTLSLRAFEARQEGMYISFKLLLSVSGRGVREPFSGRLQFTAKGERDGEEQTIELYPAVAPSAPSVDPATTTEGSLIGSIAQGGGELKVVDLKTAEMSPILELNFERIQRSEGLLIIPFGFSPKEITLNVLEGNRIKLSKTIEL